MKTYRIYCSVFGCNNSSLNHPELSFFRIAEDERRTKWLQLMGRSDLETKPKSACNRVCQIHFKEEDIRDSGNRKIINRNALPALKLPGQTSSEVSLFEDQQTQTDEWLEDDDGSQTEYESNDSSYSQPSSSHSTYIPSNIKLETVLVPSQITQKTENVEHTQKSEVRTFHQLCNKFLTNKLALLVKAQSNTEQQGKGNRFERDYITYCLNLYYTSPRAYRFLRGALCLPRPAILYQHCIPITTEINGRAMSALEMKVARMTRVQKNCSVMVDAMSLKENLFYNITHDKIYGFHDIEGLQTPELAEHVIVIMVRGILVNWQQPVAYAYVSNFRNYGEINKWIDKVLLILFEIGLIVRILVSGQGYDLWKVTKNKTVSVETPYFCIDGRKIYQIFDPSYLIKNVRDNLMGFNFHFGDSVAKFKHIKEFYDQDIKQSTRLAPHLTESHITPTNIEKKKVCLATQLLSRPVADGIISYVDDAEIEESGRDTANFILTMNDLFDSLNSTCLRHYSSNKHKRAYTGDESQKAFFNKMIRFFKDLKLISPKNGSDHTSRVRFNIGFQITIKSIMLLFDDLRVEGHTFLKTKRCSQAALHNLFDQIQTKTALDPTCRQFTSAYKNLFYCNIMKPIKGENRAEDFIKLLVPPTTGERNPVSTVETPNSGYKAFSRTQITSSDYNQLTIPKENKLFLVCVYLLKSCIKNHDDCKALKSYGTPDQRSHRFSEAYQFYLSYMEFSKDNPKKFKVVPSDDFVEYIEKIEEVFQMSFKTKYINSKVVADIFNQVYYKEIPFSFPCSCFPKAYLIKLFIRMRIFQTLKFNNKSFRSQSSQKLFSVPNL